MQPKTSQFVVFAKRFFLVFLFYQLIRIGFFIYNKHLLDSLSAEQILGGMRFDLSVLAYVNLPFVLLHLIPGKFQERKSYQKFLFYSFYLINLFILSLNFVDFEYFRFIGRRSSYQLITATGMEQELPGLIKSYAVDYWWIPLYIVLGFVFFWFIYRKINYRAEGKFSFSKLGILLLTLGVFFLAGRGGTQPKPLRIVDAAQYGGLKNTAVVLNTPFAIMKTIGKKESLKDVHYYSEEELNAIFNPIQQFSYAEPNRKNVVVLILESFGRERLFRGQTPFLDSLIQKSYFFENAFANGKVSIDAIPSTISSVPSLMDQTYISSSYALNSVYPLPKILNDQGYYTSFFHGAFNGSQNFDQYSEVAGFQKFYGKDEYEGPEAFDGKWGIFDEEFLQFFIKELDTYSAPFFSTLFTISSHAPYIIPEKYKGRFPKGKADIAESVAYADYSLSKFFETAKTKDWFDNTLFVITADHTSSEPIEDIWKTAVGKFRIPILFYAPGDSTLPVQKVMKNFQQIDVLPSLMDYLQIDTELITYGKSFLSSDDFVVNYLNGIYNYIQEDYYLAFDGEKSLGLYNWKKDPLLQENLLDSEAALREEMEGFIKAYIQSFNHRVKNNLLTIQ